MRDNLTFRFRADGEMGLMVPSAGFDNVLREAKLRLRPSCTTEVRFGVRDVGSDDFMVD